MFNLYLLTSWDGYRKGRITGRQLYYRGLRDKSRGASLGPVREGEPEAETFCDPNLMLNIYGIWLTDKHLRLYSMEL